MSKTFRLVEASFREPSVLSNATLLGVLQLRLGSQIVGNSNIAIAVAGDKTHTYELSFMVAEDVREDEIVDFHVVLVKDLCEFTINAPAMLLGDLRGLGNCGGHLVLVSRSGALIEAFPRLETGSVKIYRK